ncbi:germ cell-less -like 1 [Brachionus plicatilis]|uniref:Germ cell-less-like 1 n=1 Tax=Brachionus plicatilis TaxID=10195 RepID=A0A3M7TAW0_BRAPC|nr:germ cell-less -like 1 [Brachionus plicatilis]
MGSYLSSDKQEATPESSAKNPKPKKRKLNECRGDESELSDSISIVHNYSASCATSNQLRASTISNKRIKPELITPCRKKMKSTSNYIYKTLFVNGENSDIKVRALNKEWSLHKLYLCQSPYFDSMFKGCKWKESNQTVIEIAIPDQNITVNSLQIALGSFYREEIEIMPIEAINVLACASLFSLDGLITQCEAVMLENVSSHTVLDYYDAANLYGVVKVSQRCLKWLCQNLMVNDELRLGSLSLSLFEKVLGMDQLMIIQVETDLYSLCKKWLYFNLVEEWEESAGAKLDSKSWQKIANEFFKNLLCDKQKCLLDYDEYKKYSGVFGMIRLQHIMSDLPSLRLLYSDRIIPGEWIEPLYAKNWLNLLFVDQDRLSNEFEIEPDQFESQALRFGRVLSDEQPATWRWVGFNYGVDLLVTHAARTLTLKRNTINMHSPYKGLLSNKTLLRIYYAIKLVELDPNGNELWSKKTDIQCLDLNRSEEKYVISVDCKVKYPILLNLLVSVHPFSHSYFQTSGANTSLLEQV